MLLLELTAAHIVRSLAVLRSRPTGATQCLELIVSCDHDLFSKATRYGHCLHHLLPATRPVDHLRPRGHPFQLYLAVADLHQRSFIVRSLYNFM